MSAAEHVPCVSGVGPRLEGVRWAYHVGFYDGPMSGMAGLADGSRAWAELIEECDCYDEELDRSGMCGFYRRYQLYRLAPRQAEVEAERHADFQRYVGMHTDYVHDRRCFNEVRPQSSWKHFYKKWGLRSDMKVSILTDAEPIGWWER